MPKVIQPDPTSAFIEGLLGTAAIAKFSMGCGSSRVRLHPFFHKLIALELKVSLDLRGEVFLFSAAPHRSGLNALGVQHPADRSRQTVPAGPLTNQSHAALRSQPVKAGFAIVL